MERNHIGTMGRNYKRNPKPEYNEPKNLRRRATHKYRPQPDSEQKRKQRNIKPSYQETTNIKPVDNLVLPLADGRPDRRLKEKLQGLGVSTAGDP